MNKKRITKKSKTDWAKFDAMKDEDIDFSDIPPVTEEFWKNAVPFDKLFPKAAPKESITMRVDPEVLKWYKRGGRGYQTRINFALRKFMLSNLKPGARASKSKGGKVPS